LFQLDAATAKKATSKNTFPDNLNDYAARDKLANEIAAAYVPSSGDKIAELLKRELYGAHPRFRQRIESLLCRRCR
jgi:hypothetical protein